MPDPTPEPATVEAATLAADQLPATTPDPDTDALAQLLGGDYAAGLIRAGGEHLADTYPLGLPPGITADEIAATVLLGAMADFTREEIEAGLLEGARQAVRDAERAALAETLRAAFRAAKSTPGNPLKGLIDFADAAGVDLDAPPAPPAKREPLDGEVEHLAVVIAEARLAGIHSGGYTLARCILEAGYSRTGQDDDRVLNHDVEGRTAYRFVAPGVLLTGDASVALHGDLVTLEQTAGGQTYQATGSDEVGAILALVAAQQGLAAVFLPKDTTEPGPLSERKDPAFQMIVEAVSQAGAATDRILPLADRTAIATQVYRDLREAGVIK